MATLGNYSVSLSPESPIYDPVANEQTWIYLIEKTDDVPGREISYFAVELCVPSIHKVLRASKNGAEGDVINDKVTTLDIEISSNLDNQCLGDISGVERQIKWDELSDADLEGGGEFGFTLEGSFEKGSIAVVIKGGSEQSGGGCFPGELDGPLCEEPVPPPKRGIDYTKIPSQDFIRK